MKIAPDDCALCPNLVAGRHCVVHGQGANGGVMVVGQHASTWEDEHGFPFAGKPGLMLRHFLDNAGIPAGKVYRTNVLKCATPGGKKQRKPSKAELDACHAYLMAEIEEVKPKVIVTLGDAALQALYGGTDTSEFKRELEGWEAERAENLELWQLEVEMWGVASKVERKEIFPSGKPRKPAAGPKPKPPKATHTALKDVAGHTLIQPETGIPMVATYHPSFISHGKWSYVDPVAEHFKKAGRILTGQQKAGQLGEYAVIEDLESLEALHDYLLSPEVPIIWFDCETFGGLDWMENEILCFSFSGAEGEGFVVPLWHHDDITGKAEIWPAWQDFGAIEWFAAVDILRDILGSDKPKGGHNVLYDIRESERDVCDPFMGGGVLTALGLKVNGRIIDTELESVAVEESLPHNMTFMLASKTDMPYYEGTGITAMKKAMDKAPDNLVHEYSAADADGLPRLHKPLRKQIDREGVGWVLDNITTPMLKVCRTLETNGFPIDKPHFDNLCVFYDEQINLAEEELWGCVLHLQPGWKYNHSATLARVLFQDLNLPPSGRKTEAGKGCEDCDAGDCDLHDQTGKAALEDIMRVHPHPVLPILLRLKRLTKMRSTYLHGSDGKSGFLKHIRKDCRVHPTYKVSRAETGRLASEKPNGQNMPNYVHIHPAGAKCSEVGCTAMYDETFGINSENAYHDVIKSDKPGWWIMNCLAAGARVLTADLCEVRVEDVRVGDRLVGIDEEIPQKYGRRVMRTSTVTNTAPRLAECYDVHYGGHIVTASAEHPWLVWRNTGYCWRRTDQLRIGDRLLKAPELVSMAPRDAGYLAGFLDGEGWTHCGGAVAFGQRPGPVLDEVLRLLAKYHFQPTQQAYNSSGLGKGDVERYTFTSSSESIRLLGSARPLRLLENYNGGRGLYEGKAPTTPRATHNWHTVTAIEVAGTQTVYAIETDTHTYVAEGAFQHNCDWSQAEVWVLAYRLLKYTGDHTLLDVLLSGVDIHLWMARQMFPEVDPEIEDGEWKKTYPELRRRAKTCIFGIGYGLTVQGYMQREHCEEEEAEDIISRYMARIPGLKKLFAMVRHHLETRGYEDNEFGRRRHITSLPLLQALRERGELEKLVREAINFPIQSGASDLHSIATYCTWLSMGGDAKDIKEQGRMEELIKQAISQAFVNPHLADFEIEMILTVHDSLSFEFKYETDRLPNQTNKQWEEANDERANALARIIKDMWESIAERIIKSDGTPLGWKIPVEVEWGPTWGTPKYKVDARGTLQLQENLVEEKETYDQKFGPDDDNKPSLIKKK